MIDPLKSGYRLHDLLPVCRSLIYLMKNAYSIGKANLKGAKNIVWAKYSSDDCANVSLSIRARRCGMK